MRFLLPIFLLAPINLFALCVNQDTANLRKGPNRSFEKTFEAIRYTPLEKISKKNGWYRVKILDGTIHWVKEDLVTGGFKCGVIKGEFSNLRKGSRTGLPMAKGERGEKFLSIRLLKEQGRWIRLEDVEGDVVWAARENLWIP